ncbi:hypothetical protein L2E82_12104 [Cichorium intybus]|uniref:Uncharacterized protein n=1 Tax=Cichorium intybus TaxID=13427 RepID=A0ACB9GFB8_CICIN|nr:hypothetical protein L2E82_12104 [Cichorium intybus]
MAIHHVNVVAPASTKEANSKKSKKPLDTRKIRLQHPQAGKDIDVVLVNHEGEPVCNLCEKTFVTMKSLYDHMMGHSDGDWKAFFAPPPATTTFDNEAKVVDSMEPPIRWKMTGKRGRSAVAADHNDVKASKVPNMGYGRSSIAEPSVRQRQIQAEETEGRAEGFKLDLNHPPTMDV